MTTLSAPARATRPLLLALAALLLGVFLAVASPAQPAAASCGGTTFVSNETELNAAITAFNAVATSPCVFTIQLTFGIDLTASTTAINNATTGVELVIQGGGFAVDGQGTLGVLPFFVDSNTKVGIDGLTITGGNSVGSVRDGGGLENYGDLTLTNSTVSGNSAGDEGGGISNFGTMRIEGSTISGNTSGRNGGGIINQFGLGDPNQFDLTILNSTISGNTTGQDGGGVYNRDGASITIDSTTIADNTGTRGGAFHIRDATSTATIRSTILPDSSSGFDCDGDTGVITDGGHNLIESQSAFCSFTNGVNGNIVGSDPVLDPLADNGGDTETHALLAGSPALDAGDTTLTTDQRGVSRPQGAADDIGAFEIETGSITVIKDADPADDTLFQFELIGGDPVTSTLFTLQDPLQPTQVFTDVVPGIWGLGEYNLADGWVLTEVDCQSTLGTSDFIIGGDGVNIDLASGDDVTCTFRNTYDPLAVTLAGFDAQAQAGHVLVTWETVSELDNAGFNLYRTGTPQAPTAADLLASVPSQGPGSAQGSAYSYPDYAVTAGEAYWYWLEDVDFNGVTTMHGPVSVVFVSSTAVTLSGLEAAADQPAPVWPWLLAVMAVALAAALAIGRRRSSSAA